MNEEIKCPLSDELQYTGEKIHVVDGNTWDQGVKIHNYVQHALFFYIYGFAKRLLRYFDKIIIEIQKDFTSIISWLNFYINEIGKSQTNEAEAREAILKYAYDEWADTLSEKGTNS
jgi:hypothetical protein